MCKIINTILVVFVVMLFAASADAQIVKRYPPICTDVSDLTTAQEEGFVPCDWYQTGTSATTPQYVRLVDQNTALMLDVQRLNTITAGLASNYNGAITVGTMWLYNAATDQFIPWRRIVPSDTLMNADLTGPVTLSGNMGYITSTNRWARFRLDTSYRLITSIQDPIDASGNVQVGIYDTSGNGPATFGGGAGAAGLRIAPPNDLRFQVSDDNNANAVGNTIHVELSDGATPFLDNTASPGYLRLQDNDSTVLGDILDSSTGATIASTLNGIVADVRLRGWDGAAWAPALIGAVGEMQYTDVAVRPGERAGTDDRAIFKKDTAVRAGPTIAGTAVTDASAIVCASTYVLNLPNWSVFVKNAGGGAADAFTDVDVQISYNGTDWSSETSTACDTLTTGLSARCYKGATESAAYVQVVVDVAGGDTTTADCVVIGNKN